MTSATDPNSIPLRDIHLPEAVAWWPLAPGWWLLVAVVLLLVVAALSVWYLRRQSRVQRAALSALQAIENNFATQQDAYRCAQDLSALSRQVTLQRSPDSAALTGSLWLARLSELQGEALPAELAPVLLEAPYSPSRAATLDKADYATAIATVRAWIMQLGKRSRPRRHSSSGQRDV